MKIGELATRTGITAHTLRYYERIGLLPRAPRSTARQREYDPDVIVWIEFIKRLKTTNMPLKQMLLYAKLRSAGISTGMERAEILKSHRATVKTHITDLQGCLKILDKKITDYERNSNDQPTRKRTLHSRHKSLGGD